MLDNQNKVHISYLGGDTTTRDLSIYNMSEELKSVSDTDVVFSKNTITFLPYLRSFDLINNKELSFGVKSEHLCKIHRSGEFFVSIDRE